MPNDRCTHAGMKRLANACEEDVHEFWSDEVSLMNPNVVDSTRIHSPRQLTDIYLLALAVEQEGRFVTFDTGVPLAVVRKATADNLVVL
jgi:predicted nucleic acid-binding protein